MRWRGRAASAPRACGAEACGARSCDFRPLWADAVAMAYTPNGRLLLHVVHVVGARASGRTVRRNNCGRTIVGGGAYGTALSN